ncbi:MAG TPA: NHL repeat-containing protein [Verrucomicrobiae bacterium]|jgi:sugar lactone lactonase YvrE
MKQHSLRCLSLYLWLGIVFIYGAVAARGQSVYPTPSPYTFTTLTNLAGVDPANDANDLARFLHSRGVAVDDAGTIYFANTRSHTICRLTSAGDLTVLAGQAGSFGSVDGTGNAARFFYPQGVALDSAGNIYVADGGNNTIRRITPAGVVTTLAGLACQSGSADGNGSHARFAYPASVAVDSAGNIYVADLYNFTIRKVTPDGAVTTLAGEAENDGAVDGQGSAARFKSPCSVAVGKAGDIYVLDMFNGIRKISHSGQVTTLAGRETYSVGSADGTGRAAQFNRPSALAVDAAENIYVTDTANDLIRRISPNGSVITLAGQAGQTGERDGTGDAARFDHPTGIALDRAGNLYVGDLEGSRMRKGFPAKPAVVDVSPKAGGSLSFANP